MLYGSPIKACVNVGGILETFPGYGNNDGNVVISYHYHLTCAHSLPCSFLVWVNIKYTTVYV